MGDKSEGDQFLLQFSGKTAFNMHDLSFIWLRNPKYILYVIYLSSDIEVRKHDSNFLISEFQFFSFFGTQQNVSEIHFSVNSVLTIIVID